MQFEKNCHISHNTPEMCHCTTLRNSKFKIQPFSITAFAKPPVGTRWANISEIHRSWSENQGLTLPRDALWLKSKVTAYRAWNLM